MTFTISNRSAGRGGLLPPQVLALVLAFAALLGAMLTSQWIERRSAPDLEAVQPIVFPRLEVLRPALLGFEGLAADLIWLRTIQYYGGRVERRENFPQLYQLVDLVTSLDPHFLDAYLYGALFLDIARQYPQAIAIYKKGIAAYPEDWQLPHDLGRLYFLDLRDYPSALYWWQQANRLPGHPEYLPRFIARLYAKTGALETAYELWRAMYLKTKNEWVRDTARQEMQRILTQLRSQPGR